jgi:hypothetical protein
MMRKTLLSIFLGAGLVLGVKADLMEPILITTPAPQAEAMVEETVGAELGVELTTLLRHAPVVDLTTERFTIDITGPPPPNQAFVSWDLTGTGEELLAVYVFAGGQAFIYEVTEDQRLVGVDQLINTPFEAAFGHIAFLGITDRNGIIEPPVGVEVSDLGGTLALFSLCIGGLALFRRRLHKS